MNGAVGPFDPAEAAAQLATPNEFFRFAVAEFEKALEEEAEHLENVRSWIAAAQNRTGE